MKRQFLIVIVVSIFIAPLFSSAQEEKTQFTNVTNILGIGEYGGSGVSWGDYDGDGQEDLLLCGGGTKLLKNDKGKFRDVTKDVKLDTAGGEVGYWGDYDNDGDLDIFFTPDKLLRNDNSIFVDVSKEAGFPALGGKYAIESAAWGDYDGDGYIDIVIPCIYPSDKPWTPAPLPISLTTRCSSPSPRRPSSTWCNMRATTGCAAGSTASMPRP